MKLSVNFSKRVFCSLLSVALGSTALFTPLVAHAGFELTPAEPTKEAVSSPEGGLMTDRHAAPLPIYEGLKPVDSAPLPMAPAPSGKAVPLDMKPLERISDVPPVSAPVMKPVPAPVVKRESVPSSLVSDEMLPLPVEVKDPLSVESEAPVRSEAAIKPVESRKMAPPPGISSGPSLTGPVVSARFSTIEGFGRDVPLALAMRQIVPPDYAFSFGEGVDPGQRISWVGGAPWDDVLQKSIASSRLDVHVSGQTVVVSARKSSDSPSAPVMTAAPVVPAVVPVVQHVMSPAAGLAPLPRTAGGVPGAPVSLAPVVQKISVQESETGSMPSDIQPSSGRMKPFMKAPVSGEASPSPPVSVVAKSGVDAESLLPPVSSPPSSLEQDRSSEQVVARVKDVSPALPVFAPVLSEGKPEGKAPLSSRVFDPNVVKDWSADSGETLRKVLSDWSREAGVQLYWSSEYDYPLQADVLLNGTYEKAVATLLDGLRDAQPRPVGRLHPNLPDGPAILIIETRRILN